MGAGIVTGLPIVVETYPWLSVIFGALVIGVSITLGRAVIESLRSGDATPSIAAGAVGALFALGLGLSVALQNVHWQFRLDQQGVVLRAPFDYLRPSGKIAWADLTSVYVAHGGYRGPSFKLHFVGKDGTDITLLVAEDLPAQFGPLLQAVVVERAPQAKGAHDIAGQLAYARENSSAGISNGYWARNGRGERLR